MRAPLRNVAVVEDPSPAEAPIMLPTEDLFVHVYVLIDDAIAAGEVTIPARPGPTPACSDAELLTIALVRHLLGRRERAGRPLRPRRCARRVVLRLSTGGPGRPGVPAGARLEHRARRGQRA